MQTASHAQTRPSNLQALFTHYIAGQINDASWDTLMHTFDADVATQPEREAIAAFYRDALRERDAFVAPLPKVEEVQDLLFSTRDA